MTVSLNNRIRKKHDFRRFSRRQNRCFLNGGGGSILELRCQVTQLLSAAASELDNDTRTNCNNARWKQTGPKKRAQTGLKLAQEENLGCT